ncbi:MAG: DNA-directed RNA polymerase subunit N [Nanoarchaeota archaeon]|nr:DNA-directed RNA polymerase subunit N [Nanoarchaeota archaeon]|tara:strand:+ start:3681 stop:3878 length:198 start_codon:yes stop_codon:yes gene_type:complete
MIIAMRCFSCGKPVSHLHEKYLKELEKGKKPKEVMDKLGLERYCCRALFLGHVELLDTVARFKRS